MEVITTDWWWYFACEKETKRCLCEPSSIGLGLRSAIIKILKEAKKILNEDSFILSFIIDFTPCVLQKYIGELKNATWLMILVESRRFLGDMVIYTNGYTNALPFMGCRSENIIKMLIYRLYHTEKNIKNTEIYGILRFLIRYRYEILELLVYHDMPVFSI